jgi:hypothetical protein
LIGDALMVVFFTALGNHVVVVMAECTHFFEVEAGAKSLPLHGGVIAGEAWWVVRVIAFKALLVWDVPDIRNLQGFAIVDAHMFASRQEDSSRSPHWFRGEADAHIAHPASPGALESSKLDAVF